MRSLELGRQRATSEILARLESLPQAAISELDRLVAQIKADGQRTATEAEIEVQAASKQVFGDAVRMLDECASEVAIAQIRADAVSPRNVLAARHAILRDDTGSPVTSAAALQLERSVVAEMRDGSPALYPAPVETKKV